MSETEFDYIVVGSGAGGGPLAARLAEANRRVLLLEAGGDDEPYNYQVPVLHGRATEDPAMRLDFFVRHYQNLKRQSLDNKYDPKYDGVYYPRARTLGGCTAHYAMIIIRPHDSDWQVIQDATGDASWAPQEMHKYFARVEHWQHSACTGSGHGTNGWLPTRFPDVVSLGLQAFRHLDSEIGTIAVKSWEANGQSLPISFFDCPLWLGYFKAKFDPNDLRVHDRKGVGAIAVPMAISSNGRRAGTRERIRQAQATGGLEVRQFCHVTRVIFDEVDPLRAVGVEYLSGDQLYRADRDPSRFKQPIEAPQVVRAKCEVILAAGAYITPQLLMLSGIGPEQELKELGIDLRVNLAGVGKNLQDRYEVGIVAQSKKYAGEGFPLLKKANFDGPTSADPIGDEYFRQWRKHGTGLYATNGAVIGFLERSSVAENGEPDLFIFGVPGAFTGYYIDWSKESVAQKHDKWTWLLLKAHARFRGRVRLKSKDPLDPPVIDFNYFERDASGTLTPDAEKDLKAMCEGVEVINRLLDGCRENLELHPTIMKDVDLQTRQGISDFVQNRAWGHHASCTCKIGSRDDSDAVLDSSFRVHGVRGLRVVDASVFPKIPGFFIVMPIYMIAEKAADAILREAH